MKKLFSVILSGAIAVSLMACGSSTQSTAPSTTVAKTSAAATVAETTVKSTEQKTIAAGTTAAAATTKAGTPAATSANGKKLLFLQTHNNNSFMSYMGEMFVKIAKEHGFEVDHLTADSDEAKQLSQIEQGVSSGQYAGIICDCTGNGVSQGFKEAREAGIHVITLHEGIEDNTYVECRVACSLADTGYQAISLEVKELGDAFNLAIVNGSEGHGATVAIRKGYDKALKEYPNIKVVFDGAGNWNAEDAMALTESWFSSGTKIDGVVSMNDGMATGVRQVMKDNGVIGKIPIYSNDCEKDTLKAIEAGEQRGSFDMNAEAQCTAAIEAMEKLISGEKLDKDEIYVQPLLVTKDNLADYQASHNASY